MNCPVNSVKAKQGDKILVNTQDYLATSTLIEFKVQKSANSKPVKQIFEQMQNLHTLYRSKPRFGPESSEECIAFMSYLRPIEYYFDHLDGTIAPSLENFGRGISSDRPLEPNSSLSPLSHEFSTVQRSQTSDDELDLAETELSHRGSTVQNYLNEQPIDRDRELVYSMG